MAESLWPYVRRHYTAVTNLDHCFMTFVFEDWKALRKARPYYDVLAAYHAFVRVGGQLDLMTSRCIAVAAPTQLWCKKWFLPDPIFSVKKAETVQTIVCMVRSGTTVRLKNAPIWVVDDDPTVLQTMHEIQDESLTIYKMDRPWNKRANEHSGFLADLQRVMFEDSGQ
jgi:hypothetical protein